MLGGNIVVMDEGRVLQTGGTTDVYHNPATTRAAEVFSDPPINYLDGSVAQGSAMLGDDISFTLNGHMRGLAEGPYRFGVRSNHLFLSPSGPRDTEIQARVELSEINGSETFIHIKHGNTSLVVQNQGVHQIKIGSTIKVYVNPSRFFVYGQDGTLVASPSGNSAAKGPATPEKPGA